MAIILARTIQHVFTPTGVAFVPFLNTTLLAFNHSSTCMQNQQLANHQPKLHHNRIKPTNSTPQP